MKCHLSLSHGAIAAALVSVASILPHHVHAQISNSMVWTVTDLTDRARCLATWSRELNGVVTVLHQQPCAAGTVVLWRRVSLAEAQGKAEPYLPVSASQVDMLRFQHRVIPSDATVPAAARPYSDCSGIFHATTSNQQVWNGSDSPSWVTTDQGYDFNSPSCTTKYVIGDTGSFNSGNSGVERDGDALLIKSSTGTLLTTDGYTGCRGLPQSGSFNNYAVAASTNVYTTMVYDWNSCRDQAASQSTPLF